MTATTAGGSTDGSVAACPRVLIVDDEPDVRLMVALALRRGGRFDVVGEAGDGAEAIALAEELQPDAILLDLMMPGVDGWEALPRLLRVSPRSMIAVLSALDAEEHARATLAVGAYAYLEKQLATSGLGDQLEELLTSFSATLDGRTVVPPSVADPRFRPR